MTSVFSAEGKNLPCTVIEVGPCVVTQIKTLEKDGYEAVQLGFEEKKEKHTTQPEMGHFKKAGVTPKRYLAEFKNFGLVAGEVGEEIPFEILVVDQLGVQAQIDTAVAHFADILPCLVESDDVNNGSLKQQVPGNLVIEVCREFQPVVP